MKCLVCGADLPEFAQFCGNCNTPTGYQVSDQRLSEKEFYKHPCMKKCRSNILCSAIILYACAFISLFVSVILMQNVLAFLDIVLLLCMGLGIQIGRSRVCAIVVTVYGVINMVAMTIMTGKLAGWWVLVAGIFGIIFTFQYRKAWKNYQNTGIMPNA